jgi:tRNA acetyltransferase TAN1
MYDFNILVSCPWGEHKKAQKEIMHFLERLGEEKPFIRRTIAEGIIGVKTCLNPREVIHALQTIFNEESKLFQHTLKWVPVEVWTYSDLDSMKTAVKQLRNRIREGERWRMTVEKRRYTKYHKDEIVRELAELINEKVDLKNPDKILRIDIIGKYAGISVLEPKDMFSTSQ